jgi:hypothetical protein
MSKRETRPTKRLRVAADDYGHEQALSWLERQLRWEARLDELRAPREALPEPEVLVLAV